MVPTLPKIKRAEALRSEACKQVNRVCRFKYVLLDKYSRLEIGFTYVYFKSGYNIINHCFTQW